MNSQESPYSPSSKRALIDHLVLVHGSVYLTYQTLAAQIVTTNGALKQMHINLDSSKPIEAPETIAISRTEDEAAPLYLIESIRYVKESVKETCTL